MPAGYGGRVLVLGRRAPTPPVVVTIGKRVGGDGTLASFSAVSVTGRQCSGAGTRQRTRLGSRSGTSPWSIQLLLGFMSWSVGVGGRVRGMRVVTGSSGCGVLGRAVVGSLLSSLLA